MEFLHFSKLCLMMMCNYICSLLMLSHVEASHLCGNKWCANPMPLHLESAKTNNGRSRCTESITSKGNTTYKHGQRHDPSCLL